MKFDIKEWLIGQFEAKEAGNNNLRFNCPFCNDKKGRLYVSYVIKTIREKKIFPTFCQNEQRSYSIEHLYSVFKNVSEERAWRIIYGKDNGEPEFGDVEKALNALFFENDKAEEDIQVSEDITPPHGYTPLWGLSTEEWEKRVPEYMRRRKVDQELSNRYFLGFTKPGDNVWCNRMIIPIYRGGKLVSYQGRAMYDTKNMKYIFKVSKGLKISECLFNFDYLNFEADYIIITEGVFDVWAVIRAGFTNVIASFGKHITEIALDEVLSKFKRVFILWDEDAKGEICSLASKINGIVDVYVTNLKGKDPDESSIPDIQNAIMSSIRYTEDFYYKYLTTRLS